MGLPTLGNGQATLEGLLKMFAFRIIAFTDLPLIQLLTACCVGWSTSIGCNLWRRLVSQFRSEPAMKEAVPSS